MFSCKNQSRYILNLIIIYYYASQLCARQDANKRQLACVGGLNSKMYILHVVI